MFAELKETTISFVMSVHLSVLNNLAPTIQILMKFGIWVSFENLPKEVKFH